MGDGSREIAWLRSTTPVSHLPSPLPVLPMIRTSLAFASFLLTASLGAAQSPVPAEPGEAERRALSPPKTVRLQVEDPGHEPLRAQAAEHAAALLAAAGYSTTPVAKPAVEVRIVLRRRPLKSNYSGAGERFTGAEIEGTWTWSAEGVERSFAFSGRRAPPPVMTFRTENGKRVGFETEDLAPWAAAFANSTLTLEFLKEQKRLAGKRSIEVLGPLAPRFWCSAPERVALWIEEKDADPRIGRSLAEDWIRVAGSLVSERNRLDEALLRKLTRALETLRPESAAAEARRVLAEDGEWLRRAKAAELLGILGGPESVAALLKAFADRDQSVRGSAMRSCGRLRASEALEPLLAELRTPDSPSGVDAATALGLLGDKRAWEDILGFLERSKSWARGRAAEALGRLGDARAVDLLAKELKSSDAFIRSGAARGLGGIEDGRIGGLLESALADPERQVRLAAVDALVSRRDDRCVDVLVKDLDDRDLAVVDAACVSLARLRSPKAVPALIRRVEFPDIGPAGAPSWERASMVAETLTELAGESFGTGLDGADRWRAWWEAQGGRLPAK